MEGKFNIKIIFEFIFIIFIEGCPRLSAIGFDPKVSVESVNLCEKIPNVG